MKQCFLLLIGAILLGTFPVTAQETTEEWISLFDGSTLAGWHRYNGNDMPSQWSIIDNTLVFSPSVEPNDGKNKNIVTDQEFESFVLSIEWKISPKGNSGIFWAVQEGLDYEQPYHTGPEIQVLDNERHPDAFRKPKYHQAGALYDIVQPRVDVCKQAGEWNHVVLRIDHQNNNGSVKLNGTQIHTFPVHGPEWETMIANSKFGNRKAPDYTKAPDFGQFRKGKIGLQDHGDLVAYRNIKIKKL